MPKSRGIQGGLTRGRLFDTNIKATSIDEDIFTDQEVLSSIAGDDLVLVLDVSETPDKIKYITRTNFTAGITTVTVTDNESTAENNLITFVADAATATGAHGLEMDGDFHYNPNTGTLTATNLTGTLGTASQPNVTTLAGVTTMGTVSNALTLTFSDATLYHDANNADTSFAMGTSATEALKIEVLNGGSNKTAESIAFTTYTASSTGDHGKITFSVDEADVMLTIDDGGISIAESGAYEIDGTAILSDSSGTLTLQNVDALDATTESTIESALDTLSNLTSIGSTGSTTNFVAGDVTVYNAVNGGNPSVSLGSGANERLAITTTYDTSAQTLDKVEFATHAASGTANKGKFVFDVDGTDIFDIDDSGINLASGKTFRVNGATTIGSVYDFSDAAIADGDSILFSDSDDSNATKRDALADVATLFAGAGMTATSSVLNVIAGTGIDVTSDAVAVDVSDFMSNGANNYVVTATGTDAMNAEAQLTFDGDVLAITGTGSATGNKDILTITNDANASSMTATETSILFNQWYYDGSSPAVADAGRISIGTEGNWTSTGSTQDAYMALETALNGTVTENVRITSAGLVGINNTDPGSLLDVRGDAGAPGILTLSTAETTVVDGDKLGRIDFQAPKETGADALLVSAAIWAESDVTFDATNNATDLVIALGHSEAAAEKFRFTSQNELGIAGANYGTDGQVLTSGGAGAAVAWEDAATGDITGVTAGVGLSGGGTSGGVTLTLDLSELSAVTPAASDSFSTLDSDGANEQLTTTDALATLFAGTGLTASSAVIGVDASQAINALTGGDLTIYDDQNNADVSFKMGTSATEALSIEVLNGGSDKINVETKFQTTTGDGTANYGKFSFYVDEAEILDIDDGGIDLASGMTFAVNGTDVVSATGANTALTSVYNSSLAVGYGASHANIDFGTDNSIIFDIDGTSQIQLDDGILKPTTDVDVDLGTATLRYKSLYAQKFAMDASADGIAEHDYSGITALLRVGDGADVGAFDLVCISDVTNEVQIADADAVATSKVIGINPSNSAISDNSEGIILLHGIVRDDSWGWTTGQTLYLSTTAGDITATAPTGSGDCVVPIGVALEPDMIYFNPTQSIVELA